MGFADNITKWNEKALRNSVNTFHKAVKLNGYTLVDRWPVGNPSMWSDQDYASYARANGYEGGHSRANIQTSINSRITTERTDNAEFPKPFDPNGTWAKGQIDNAVSIANPEDTIFISITVDYARDIEFFGHSGQAPNGAMRITADEFGRHIKEVSK